MTEASWIKPRSSYEKDAADQAASANTAATNLYSQLKLRESEFTDHGFEICRKGNLVAVRIGNIDIMRVVFGYGGTNIHRVTDGVREASREPLSWDCKTIEDATARFRNQLSSAVDYFYRKQDEFRALGIV